MLNLIGVVIAFAVIIVLIRKKVNFGLSLILGSIIVGIFSLTKFKDKSLLSYNLNILSRSFQMKNYP